MVDNVARWASIESCEYKDRLKNGLYDCESSEVKCKARKSHINNQKKKIVSYTSTACQAMTCYIRAHWYTRSFVMLTVWNGL